MNNKAPNALGRALRGFFADHLPRVRGASSQTVQSYRDTFVLLLRFVAAQRPTSVTELDVEDLGPQVVLNFLHYLAEPSQFACFAGAKPFRISGGYPGVFTTGKGGRGPILP
jgi:hypothetical protein